MGKFRTNIDLIEEDEQWLKEMFPGLTSSWIHQRLMSSFREQVEREKDHIMQKYINAGAEAIKNQLLEGE